VKGTHPDFLAVPGGFQHQLHVTLDVIEIFVEDQMLWTVREDTPGFGSRLHQREMMMLKPMLEPEFPGIGRGNPEDICLHSEIRHNRRTETAYLDGMRIITVRKPEPLVFGQHAEEKHVGVSEKKSIFD
jgi:hypothetical protein